ncbi:uncharacterized protein SAPINGB_P002026 [Magnusiomyces paraingens]|uniref:Decapping nuclease n=1 Tax=Magnusiomyces paraingens TaxID=2606893 RepID=A0A5E8BHF2_9ASCO|nr:uncharacterized protein SAPINGB_P002026 [Saprochaete ingens]VVT48941.1 unnamed protein product [Saprochaete ingens]
MPKLSLETRPEKPAALRRPKQLLAYSIDKSGEQHIDDYRSLRYFYYPDTSLAGRPQLSSGFSNFVKRDESVPKHLNELLRALTHYEKVHNDGKKVKVDIITYRGVMTKLLVLAQVLKNRFGDEDVTINATYFDGSLLMELDATVEQEKNLSRQVNKNDQDKERDQQMTYWGYKFESLATLTKPWTQCTREEIESRDKIVVDNISEYCCLVRTGVGKVKMILGAEVDAIYDYNPYDKFDLSGENNKPSEQLFNEDDKEKDILPHYVELKTTKVILNPRVASTFLLKLLRTWAQCFLIGVPKVVYGFRDDNGYLKSVEEYDTEDLPKLIASAQYVEDNKKWNGNECIAFYAAAVEWIKNNIPKEEGQVWRIQYRKGDKDLKLVRVSDFEEEQRLVEAIVEKDFKNWRQSLGDQ